MLRLLTFILCLICFTAQANSPLQIDKRLGLNSQQSGQLTLEQQLIDLNDSIQSLISAQLQYQQQIKNFDKQKRSLTEQIKQTKTPLSWNKEQDLNQQASMAYLQLSELKQSETELSAEITRMLNRHKQLPNEIQLARQVYDKHLKNELAPVDTPLGRVQQAQRKLYHQNIVTLEAELTSSHGRLELNQLQLQLVRKQLSQQEQLIERLNQQISLQRQQQTTHTLAQNLLDSSNESDPLNLRLSKENKSYGEQLQLLTHKINQAVLQQEKAEQQYQQQANQLSNIQEQITWVKMNAAFGERFLQMLQALPKAPNQELLQTQIADARLARYHIEQQQAANQQDLQHYRNSNAMVSKLLHSQKNLLEQLQQSYNQYLSELAKLKVNYEQLSQQYLTLKNTLSEHLFWVPNATSISKLWLTDFHRSTQWLIQQAPWGQISQAINEQSSYWSWWILLVVLCLVTQDLVTPKYNRALQQYLAYVGNVTQDKFIFTFKAIISTIAYTLIKPLPIIIAGLIFYDASTNFAQAIGMAIMSMGFLYLLKLFVQLLSETQGVLIGHFKRPDKIVKNAQLRLNKLIIITMPLIGIMGFTEVLDLSLIRNSIGRGAFIIFCILLFIFYKDLLMLVKQYRHDHLDDKNKKLLQKILWAVLIGIPVICAVLAFQGYYFTAFQMLLQEQLSILLGLGFLLLYQLIKRWMLIERRRIAFDRAKAKRAERLAAREKSEALNHPQDMMDTYEEPIVDLETMSSQSLGMVRSLLILAFLASLIGLWSQTHTALFSFLDGITLWTSNSVVNGIEQLVPITIKSLLLGLIIFGFSMMIATNLPGLLELMLLQRLDLSPGTGFAITTVSRYLVLFIGMLIGFSTLGVEWSKLQWLIAALSVGLGFGLQEIFANFISGLIILFEKPIRIGDTVTIRDLTGTVSKIQTRATTIIDWDRKEIIVPNKAFITEQLVNWSLSDPITRVIIYISVARDSDPAKVEAALYQAVQECQDALDIPEPEVWFAGFGPSTQDYEVRAYAKDMSARWPLKHDLHKRITKKLRENDLVMAYPQMEIMIKNGQHKETPTLLRN